jgi:TRAP-type transport system periplasmic protein
MNKVLDHWKTSLAAGLLAAVLGSGSAAADTWKCYSYIPSPTHVVYTGMVKAMERFKEATGGAIDFRCNVGGSLPIDGNSIVPALDNGLLDFASSAFSSGVIPVSSIYGLPGLFETLDELEAGLDVVWPTLEAEFERNGSILVGKYIYPRQVIWSKGPVTVLKDLEGRSVRVATVEHAEFAKAFGAVPVTTPAAEVAQALQRGMVSVVFTAASGGGRLWIDSLDHTSDIGPSFAVSYILVSKKKWDTLSAEHQQQLKTIASEEGEAITASMMNDNVAARDEFIEKKGLKLTPASAEQEEILKSTMMPYWERWAKERGDTAVKMLEDVRTALKK